MPGDLPKIFEHDSGEMLPVETLTVGTLVQCVTFAFKIKRKAKEEEAEINIRKDDSNLAKGACTHKKVTIFRYMFLIFSSFYSIHGQGLQFAWEPN